MEPGKFGREKEIETDEKGWERKERDYDSGGRETLRIERIRVSLNLDRTCQQSETS